MTHPNDQMLKEMQEQAPAAEKHQWLKHGVKKNSDDVYVCPEDKPVLPRSMFKWAAILSEDFVRS